MRCGYRPYTPASSPILFDAHFGQLNGRSCRHPAMITTIRGYGYRLEL